MDEPYFLIQEFQKCCFSGSKTVEMVDKSGCPKRANSAKMKISKICMNILQRFPRTEYARSYFPSCLRTASKCSACCQAKIFQSKFNNIVVSPGYTSYHGTLPSNTPTNICQHSHNLELHFGKVNFGKVNFCQAIRLGGF